MGFAENTKVSIQKTKSEIEALLTKYGATDFGTQNRGDRSTVQFRLAGRFIRFMLTLPDREDSKRDNNGDIRHMDLWVRKHDQACRTKWRCLLLIIKAKLESADSGIESIEDCFLAQILLGNGKTVGEIVMPMLELAYSEQKIEPYMLGLERDTTDG